MSTFTIPEYITVHLGPPDSSAPNVTVAFPDYVKNVASSEIYPTWPESAIRANMYAQTSFALNRVYTEWYRSRGYNFDITNSTSVDQSFVNGRDIFSNISQLADELFNDYIRRANFTEPLFAQYCNGTTVTCNGLSQWGSVDLARQGYVPYSILTYYYGDDISLVRDTPVAELTPSFARILKIGSAGEDVRRIQIQLNRISANYPAIPKTPTDGFFSTATYDAVVKFQQLFNLTADGIVGEGTWYRIQYLYTSVKRLAELHSEGETLLGTPQQFTGVLSPGESGGKVFVLQYYLAVLAGFYAEIPFIQLTGTYNAQTEQALKAFQQLAGLPQTGVADRQTWDTLYDTVENAVDVVPPEDFTVGIQPYPGFVLVMGMRNPSVAVMQNYLVKISQAYPSIPQTNVTGFFGTQTRAAVTAFQRQFGLTPDGAVGPETWNKMISVYDDIAAGSQPKYGQFPGRTVQEGDNDYA